MAFTKIGEFSLVATIVKKDDKMKSIYTSISYRLKLIIHVLQNTIMVYQGTQPKHIFFHKELQHLLGCDDKWLQETAYEYRTCFNAWKRLSSLRSDSRKTDGFGKSLDVAEGFAVWALVKHTRPKVIVELGVLHGISALLWKEALKQYVPNHELVLCDLEDKRRFIKDSECTFLNEDARNVLPQLFDSGKVGILHNDAHPYDLIHWSVAEALKHNVPILTFHDVGSGLRGTFKPDSSQLSKEQKLTNNENWAKYGTWERHVMAEVFDTRILHEDSAENDLYKVQIFDSLFGFGVALCKT